MTAVSDNFKKLAQQNGRYVYCKINAGGTVFLDDRIIEFDFDDVIHPDRFTIGTTCANRFCFSVVYNDELEVHDEVKPYISFDGKEWCPLGVFYVARRYVRGGTLPLFVMTECTAWISNTVLRFVCLQRRTPYCTTPVPGRG